LYECLEAPAQAVFRFYQDRVVMYDFAQFVLDLFYTEEYGTYDKRTRRAYTAEERAAGFLRPMFASFLPCFSAIQVHGAGVIRNGRAALFMARDGGGKTTALSHVAEELVLNDDQIILRQENDGIVAHATPFGSMTAGPCQAPAGALFILYKAPQFELRPISSVDIVQPIWRENWGYTDPLSKDLKVKAFDVLCDFCLKTPVYQMNFPKDSVDWDAIDAAMVG
jgi:hypothetical protein